MEETHKEPHPKGRALMSLAYKVGYNGRSLIPVSYKQTGGWSAWLTVGQRRYFIQRRDSRQPFNKLTVEAS